MNHMFDWLFFLCLVAMAQITLSMRCNDGYFISEHDGCKKCPNNCLFCESDEYCLSCRSSYWGATCERTCSTCKSETSCVKINGFCLEACKDGYTGVLCDTQCDKKCLTCNRTDSRHCVTCAHDRYGLSCDSFCSPSCYIDVCDEETGKCNVDCLEECSLRCKNGTCGESNELTDTGIHTTAIAVAVVVSSVTAICILTVIIYRYWKKPRFVRNNSTRDTGEEMTPFQGTRMVTDEYVFVGRASAYPSKDSEYTMKLRKSQAKSRRKKLQTFAMELKRIEKEDFTNEFASLPIGATKSYIESEEKANLSTQERLKIYPYDCNRVKFYDSDLQHCYINASYIHVTFQKNEEVNPHYIACGGPTMKYPQSVTLFWRMVWQENCRLIAMLNTFNKEAGLFEQYWPADGPAVSYEGICVKCKDETAENDYLIRCFIGEEERQVTQIQYTNWPEHGVVGNIQSLVEFRKTVNELKQKSLVVVHGRAGVGRTGTFIALDILLDEVNEIVKGVDDLCVDINVFACVKNLREQRMQMVETLEQYQLLHKALLHFILKTLEEKGWDKKRSF